MALLNLDPSPFGQTIATTAGARAMQAVDQALSPKLVSDVQRVLADASFVSGILGIGDVRDVATPLLGGLTLRQAQAIVDNSTATRVAKKNLFFVRVTDQNPPSVKLQPRSPASAGGPGGVADLIVSRIGPSASALASGVAGAANSIRSGVASMVGAAGATTAASAALASFDLLALDVSYASSLNGDHAQVGGLFIDLCSGSGPTELQVTTMDDEAGSIKKWFEGKQRQVIHDDGTFGLPAEYLVTIEIVHAVVSEQVKDWANAYSGKMLMRPQSMALDLSRRDQALAEVQLTFSQFDSFMG